MVSDGFRSFWRALDGLPGALRDIAGGVFVVAYLLLLVACPVSLVVTNTFENGHEGLAALYAYESQIPAVAKAKIDGLAKNYGIWSDRDVAFFSVHMDADVLHSQTSRDLLRDLCSDEEKTVQAERAASQTLDALYGFLDSVTAN